MSIREKLDQFKAEIHKVIVGNDDMIELIFISILLKGHILMESVPGTGKTMLSKSVARALGGVFKRVQFSPDVLPSDIIGVSIFNPKTQSFDFKMGPVNTNVLLADEINRATPRTQAALLEVMEEKQVTQDGETYALEEPFIILATQNPIESKQGTFDLPEAQLDRFFMKIDLGYPDYDAEFDMLTLHHQPPKLDAIEAIFTPSEIRELQDRALDIEVNHTLKAYILSIVTATRDHPHIELGVSPRGSLALMRGAMGRAIIEGRDYVIPEDVKFVAPYILPHRIVLSIEGITVTDASQVIKEILQDTEVPVEYGVERDEV